MISAIQDFDEDRNESVNMRVGIHTGTVLCGIVGKRRCEVIDLAGVNEATADLLA